MAKPKIAIVVGSTRHGRFADHPANWIYELARQRSDIEVELVDLRDFPLPFFDEPASPAWVPSKSEVAQKWQKKVEQFDGFVFTAAEYNRGPTAALKNALDYAYREYNRKPATFVAYGGTGGARAAEHLRHILAELQVASLKFPVHIGMTEMIGIMREGKTMADFPYLDETAEKMLDELIWWTKALKTAREAS